MATKIETIERDGRFIDVYDNGMERDQQTGRIVRPPAGSIIRTAERANELHRRRKEKTARLIRSRLPAVSNSVLPSPVRTAAGAVAEAALQIWEEVVLNSDAYPRDRLEAWKEIGRAAEVLTDPKDRTDRDPNGPALSALTAGLNAEAARTLERIFRDVLAIQSQPTDGPTVIDGPATEPTDRPTDGRDERDG